MSFDEFSREHNVNVKRVYATAHAIQRAKERFGWTKFQDEQVIGNLRSLLRNSKYIGEVVDDENGKPSYLFAADKRAIYLSKDCQAIVTVIKHQEVTYKPLKETLLELHKKEIRKLQRKESAMTKRLARYIDDFDVELAELKRRKNRTRSQSVYDACVAREEAIKQSIQQYENDIKAIQDEKRKITRSLVAVI